MIASCIPATFFLKNLSYESIPFSNDELVDKIKIFTTEYRIHRVSIDQRILAFENSQIIDPTIRKSISDFKTLLFNISSSIKYGNDSTIYRDNFVFIAYLSLLSNKFNSFTDSELSSFFFKYKDCYGFYFSHILECKSCINHHQLYNLMKIKPPNNNFEHLSFTLHNHIYNTPRVNYVDVMETEMDRRDLANLDRLMVFYSVNILITTLCLSAHIYKNSI